MGTSQKVASLTLRLAPDDRAALERAAKREDRSVSAIVRIIIRDWRAAQRPTAKRSG
jgi:uncharacterized protein (DUF1778 family)